MKRPKLPAHSPQSGLRNQFRIIGGTWRSRRFHFPPVAGLRPTPDRVRETVFNWLADHLRQARCLDLFCGSGALGLEALSRGAAHCLFIDADPSVTTAVREHLNVLHCPDGQVITGSLPGVLGQLRGTFQVVFLDPPYALDCLADCLQQLASHALLADEALVYLECSSERPLPALPAGFAAHRHKSAGQVQYALLHYRAQASMSRTDPL